MVGLVDGFMRGWVPFAFLLAGMGFGGTLAIVIGPGLFRFVSSESGQAAAGFFLVFFLMLLLGAVITYPLRGPLTMASSLTVLFPMGFLLNRLGGLLVLQRQFKEGCLRSVCEVCSGVSGGRGSPAHCVAGSPPATAAVDQAQSTPGAAFHAPPGTLGAG